jgi:hypothetical protein
MKMRIADEGRRRSRAGSTGASKKLWTSLNRFARRPAINECRADLRSANEPDQGTVMFLSTQTQRTALAAARLVAKGSGDTKPVAANDSPANMAKNRRAELRKL